MHPSNMAYWKHAKEKYPRYFANPSTVAEFGCCNVNGTVRVLFNCDTYIGVDWLKEPDVDVVSLAHEYKPGRQFDTIISSSMLEHDPYWDKSLTNMVSLLKDDGILLLSWGGALNGAHCLWSAPDGKFHALAAAKVRRHLTGLGVFIDEFRYEDTFMGKGKISQYLAMIGFKDEKYSIEPHIYDTFHERDERED